MFNDGFILHEWEKDKLDELVRYETRKNAIEEGRKKGRKEGRKEGIEFAIVQVIKSMLNRNYSLSTISDITGKSEEEIRKYI